MTLRHFLRLALAPIALGIAAAQLGGVPSIDRQPATVNTVSGQTATFSVSATGTGPLAYRWRHRGSELPGATGASLQLPNVKMADAGFYDVVVTDATGSTVSSAGRLMVKPVGGYPDSLRLDPDFDPFLESGGATVTALAVAPDGSIYAGGNFSTIAGVRRARLARLDSSLVLDPGFAPTIFRSIELLAADPRGGVFVYGYVPDGVGSFFKQFSRLKSDGSIDPTFTTDPALTQSSYPLQPEIFALQVQPDGKLVIAGQFFGIPGFDRCSLVRLNGDGSLDPTFSPTGNLGYVLGLELYGDGRILISGRFTTVNGTPRKQVARLLANGTVDSTFDPGNDIPEAQHGLAIDSDGRAYIHLARTTNGTFETRFVRLRDNGTIDPTFAPAPSWGFDTRKLAILSNGALCETRIARTGEPSIRVLRATGEPDPSFTFPAITDGPAPSIAIATNGSVVVAGAADQPGSMLAGGVARFAATGAVLDSAAPGFRKQGASIRGLEPVSGGRWLVTGDFTHVGGVARPYLARLNADGSVDPTFDAGATVSTSVQSIALIGGGCIVTIGDWPGRIARLLPDGARDPGFASGAGIETTSPWLTARALPDGRLAIVNLSSYDGINVPGLCRVNADGRLDRTFNPSCLAGLEVYDMAVRADGALGLIGVVGLSTSIWPAAVVLSNTGALLVPGTSAVPMSGSAVTVNFDTENRLVCGGRGRLSLSSYSSYLLRLSPTGEPVPNEGESLGFNGSVTGLLPQGDGRLLAAGWFTALDDACYGPALRLDANGRLDPKFRIWDLENIGYLGAQLRYTDSGGLLITNATASRDGALRSNLVLFRPERGLAPTVLAQPADQTLASESSVTLAISCDWDQPLSYQWYQGRSGDTSAPVTGATAAQLIVTPQTPVARYWVRVSAGATAVASRTVTVSTPPRIEQQSLAVSTIEGNSATLTVTALGASYWHKWSKNGKELQSAGATLSLSGVSSREAGLYDCIATGDGGSTLSAPMVLGIVPQPGNRTAGSVSTRPEWQDIHHPNGATYDQFLLAGPSGTFTADPGQIARMSFLDENDSIVQVEMSGAGAITVSLDPDTVGYSVAPRLYNQTGITYMRGRATVILAGADATTHFTIYSVGTATNPGVTRADVDYAGWASIRAAGIVSTDGRLGGIHQGNVSYNATSGPTGLYAPNVTSVGSLVVVHDVAAREHAQPYLRFGAGGTVKLKIAGGALAQPVGEAVVVDGLAEIQLGAGQDSCGRPAPARTLAAELVDPTGNEIPPGLVVGP